MSKKTSSNTKSPISGRLSIFRPLWWILQGAIVGIWKMLITFVVMWQFLHILITGKHHAWSSEFTQKFARHVLAWTEYTFWVRSKQPDIIEY